MDFLKRMIQPPICCLQETLRFEDTERLKVKGREIINLAYKNQKRATVAILISDKIKSSNKNCF